MVRYEKLLPAHVLDSATLRGNEYAWPLEAIPKVVFAAQEAGLINVGGQLQFRLPAGTCECYWIEVDTLRVMPNRLSKQEKIEWTAQEALSQFEQLPHRWDFLAEGKKAFTNALNEYVAGGGDPLRAVCFVWYVEKPN
ncbi:MAG TPA: hypothetical protein PKC09_13040 [Paracoccus sp. (in: a-proteobacteria)]|uniref:hypothetical protein n=1 Tax=uncultured Paracoccus sp. TaxID=189685 RepID=UPI002615B6F9|nr:hypothetical protein [uncultured Paracoccus sp.]HMQ42185.1 hypothetical protein [Paracoccus sp. (in: a-proteobacteria)]HMR37153.1 hypothetical protein [Paracoccus sp. (in: a-proteobacteria)]